MQRTFLIGIPIVLIVIALGIIGYNEWVLKPSTKPSGLATTPTPQLQFRILTGLEIAKQTAKFLDSTIKPDGTFRLLYNCDKKFKDCLVADSEEIHSGYIVLAYHDLFQITGDKSYKEKADKAMDTFLQKCRIDDKYCMLDFFAFDLYYRETRDARYKDAMLSVADELLDPSKKILDYLNLNGGRKLAMLYDITGDKKYPERLEKIAQDALSGGLDNDEDNPVKINITNADGQFPIRKYSLQVIRDIYLPAYKLSGNTVYLKPAKEFLDKSFGKKDQVDSLAQSLYTLELDKIIEISLDLANIIDGSVSQDEMATYRAGARIVGEKLLGLWDTPEHKLYNGDYGFLSAFQDRVSTSLVEDKKTLTNAWRTLLFLRMSTQEFRVPTNGS